MSSERSRRAGQLALVALLLGPGCVEEEPAQKKIDPAYIKRNLLAAPPAAIQNRVDADLGGYVTYLGNDVDKKSVAPKGTVKVVHYWKVVASPGPEWRVFTHLIGSGDAWMNLDRTDMRIGYPPGEWKAGDVIRDEQHFTLDAGWKSQHAELVLGLYRAGSSGPEDRMPIQGGRGDAENRVNAFRFEVDRAGGARPKPQQYVVRRASGPIAIDGVASEADWQTAPAGPSFTSAEGGPEMKGSARARLLWDDANLYAFIEVEDADVYSQYKAQDDPLWKEDVVELFIDADRNRRGYVELQVNPRNARFDAWFPTTRGQANHPEWSSKMKTAVSVRGTLDERDDQDKGWSAEIAIPLADVKGMDAAMKVATPPALGDKWRLNVVRVDKPADGPLRASSWSAIPISDFHALGRMVTVAFGDAKGGIPSAATNPYGANPSPGQDRTSSPGGAPKSDPAAPGARPKPKTKEEAGAKSGAKTPERAAKPAAGASSE
ncbi:MAG TPA: sugar-binding protein [Kofleriaceae bacterium]|nr:sugar-binding protein [Kofleriaceae bacterium]